MSTAFVARFSQYEGYYLSRPNGLPSSSYPFHAADRTSGCIQTSERRSSILSVLRKLLTEHKALTSSNFDLLA